MVPHDDGASAPPAEDAPSSSGFLDDGKNTIGSQLASR
ncbi:MAG: GntR family transcriptional regulator, partial [Mesorhizobium sp.]